MHRRYKEGLNRTQGMLLPPTVDQYVSEDNPVRAIDAYVEDLDLAELGFLQAQGEVTAGQPAYAPQALLKLYLYGYLTRIRSSRMLERETRRNLELIWLLGGLQPSHTTIADFRKNNARALKAVNRDFVMRCKELDLYGAELVAIDGSFFRGNVAKESIATKAQLQKMLKSIDAHIDAYLQALDQADRDAPCGTLADDADLADKLAELKRKQAQCAGKLAVLEATGQTQYARVDPDARRLKKHGQSVAGYNVQIATDDKHKLIVHCEVTSDGNDTRQLAPMAQQAKAVLEVDTLEVAADAGYFNHEHIKQCVNAGITPYVPPRAPAQRDEDGERLPPEAFVYEAAADRYRCAQGQYLHFRRVLERDGKREFNYVSQRGVCAACPLRARCLPPKTPYRELYRLAPDAIIDAHRQRMAEQGKAYMRKRCGMVEHPFGTLKRWCGWQHFLVRGKQKVSGEMNLLMLCYNFKRVLSILGMEKFRKVFARRAPSSPGAAPTGIFAPA